MLGFLALKGQTSLKLFLINVWPAEQKDRKCGYEVGEHSGINWVGFFNARNSNDVDQIPIGLPHFIRNRICRLAEYFKNGPRDPISNN